MTPVFIVLVLHGRHQMTWKDWRSGLRAIAAWFSTRRLERTMRDSKKRLRLASQTALQTASLAASGPIALHRASSASSAPATVADGWVFADWVGETCASFNATAAARSAPASAISAMALMTGLMFIVALIDGTSGRFGLDNPGPSSGTD